MLNTYALLVCPNICSVSLLYLQDLDVILVKS